MVRMNGSADGFMVEVVEVMRAMDGHGMWWRGRGQEGAMDVRREVVCTLASAAFKNAKIASRSFVFCSMMPR